MLNLYKEKGLRLDKLMDHNMELLPTYMHISWGNKYNYFPSTLANKLAKGNGFNGKKVLHFTFQYTANNNTSMFGYSPSFDILRGKIDEYFRQLAKDIKKYHIYYMTAINPLENRKILTKTQVKKMIEDIDSDEILTITRTLPSGAKVDLFIHK